MNKRGALLILCFVILLVGIVNAEQTPFFCLNSHLDGYEDFPINLIIENSKITVEGNTWYVDESSTVEAVEYNFVFRGNNWFGDLFDESTTYLIFAPFGIRGYSYEFRLYTPEGDYFKGFFSGVMQNLPDRDYPERDRLDIYGYFYFKHPHADREKNGRMRISLSIDELGNVNGTDSIVELDGYESNSEGGSEQDLIEILAQLTLHSTRLLECETKLIELENRIAALETSPPPQECTLDEDCNGGYECLDGDCWIIQGEPPVEEIVIFRTNAVNGNYKDSEVMVDIGDGRMSWEYSNRGTRTPLTCMLHSPEGYCVYKYAGKVYVNPYDREYWKFVPGGLIPTTSEPLEPYSSNNQEVYA